MRQSKSGGELVHLIEEDSGMIHRYASLEKCDIAVLPCPTL